MSPSSNGISLEAMEYVINHVFLPPKLPQEDDFNAAHESFLVDTTIDALLNFKIHLQNDQKLIIESVIILMSNLKNVYSSGSINEDPLKIALKDLLKEGGTVPLHIRKQNCGILISNLDNAVRVEAFELSPLNEAVITTKGRLRRSFPGVALDLKHEIFEQLNFRDTVANTLAKMSHQPASGTRPKVTKANQEHDEDRDTTHPKMVTKLFFGFLGPLGNPVDVPRLWKNTREEVLFEDARIPWRRSPMWLLIRVAMQREISRLATASDQPGDLYKIFMLFLMSRVVELSLQHLDSNSNDLIHAMNAKLVRRLLKLDMPSACPGLDSVRKTINITHGLLQSRWLTITKQAEPSCNLSGLERLNFEFDTFITVPALDQYIREMDRRSQRMNLMTFQPDSGLTRYPADECPIFVGSSIPDLLPYDLKSFEAWVETNLKTWLDCHKSDLSTCGKLAASMQSYYAVTKTMYSGIPEAASTMILTLLELWIACDVSAIHLCEFLNDYSPGIPHELLTSLILPFKSQMDRLLRAESYLLRRHGRAQFSAPHIFSDFGHENSFSVRYFKQSSFHQHLLETITHEAAEAQQRKCEELQQLREYYNSRIALHEATEHDFIEVIVDIYNGFREQVHDEKQCTSCKIKSEAERLKIEIYEWPLPRAVEEAQSTVFELMVPQWFGQWRDTTIFLILDVLQAEYMYVERLRSRSGSGYPLSSYDGLSPYFHAFSINPTQRLSLVSEKKPHLRTHRRYQCISEATESGVCLNNGLGYKYYDSKRKCFVADHEFLVTNKMPKLCTFTLPAQASSFQQFVFRPASIPNGPSPNTVMSSQSNCLDGMSLDEYRALSAIPIGCRLQWQNILLQLSMPAVDFKKLETGLIFLQAIYQAGPPRTGDALREGHTIVGDENFANALLIALGQALERVQKNWEASQALSTLVSISARLLSLTASSTIQKKSLGYLASVRANAIKWVHDLRDKVQKATDDDQRAELQFKAIEFALICADSFNLEGVHLARVLSIRSNASILLQCSIAIQEGASAISSSSNPVIAYLNGRWKSLSHRSYSIFVRYIQQGRSEFLDDAVQKLWSAYQTGNLWEMASGNVDHWLVSRTASGNGGSSLLVHFNLLTGELLVDGLPLARLPSQYERHPMYRTLFGQACLEVMPTSAQGMQFSSKKEFFGYVLHFNIAKVPRSVGHSATRDFLVQAVKKDKKYELIPSRIIRGEFPSAFVDGFVHWYSVTDDYLEFRPAKDPWAESPDNWQLKRVKGSEWMVIRNGKAVRADTGSEWRMMKYGLSLIGIKSYTGIMLSKIFSPLEDPLGIHTVVNESFSSVDIELSRLQLAFQFKWGTSRIQSRQFRGMIVDADQSVGSLVGLHNKLVLKHGRKGNRLIIVPEGEVSYEKALGHIRVNIRTESAKKAHAYHIDTQLCRLVDNGNLQSKLFLCYLHALTSFCLPDPLIHRTGTEQALSILDSAAVRSFDRLTQDNIKLLGRIAGLAPGRTYYPLNERVMQSIEWSGSLGPMSQHGRFFQSVRSILDQAKQYSVFHPGLSVENLQLDRVEVHLLERDFIRSSTFRVSGFGAEDHTVDYDTEYASRDRDQSSSRGFKAFTISSMVYQESNSLPYDVRNDLEDHLWDFLSQTSQTYGPNQNLPSSEIQYDSKLLLDPSSFVSTYWSTLHHSLGQSTPKFDKFRLMIWLATLAFASRADMQILQTLASFFAIPEMSRISAPQIDSFQLGEGAMIRSFDLRRALESACLPFRRSPDALLPSTPEETDYELHSRRQSSFRQNQGLALDKLVLGLEAQWPSKVPSIPNFYSSATSCSYVDLGDAIEIAKPKFKMWFDNHRYAAYLKSIAETLKRQAISPVEKPTYATYLRVMPIGRRQGRGFVDIIDIFGRSAPSLSRLDSRRVDSLITSRPCAKKPKHRLALVIQSLESQAKSSYEKGYVKNLLASLLSLRDWDGQCILQLTGNALEQTLSDHLDRCTKHLHATYKAIMSALVSSQKSEASAMAAGVKQWPRVSPIFLLEQLSRDRWAKMTTDWKRCIIRYGISLSEFQRAERLVGLASNEADLIRELQNFRPTNWDPFEHPESLLMEVESSIMIREVQEQIAQQMRCPPSRANSVMQLNMGEGKSSVIVPMVAAALANGSKLVRIIVAKPQSKQMLQMLVSKFGGLLDRRVYQMPFSRALKLGNAEAVSIGNLYRDCMAKGGILLVQPEHILSFKLMCLESFISNKETVGKCLLSTQEFFDKSSRDIVDESDENFSVKFELIYTMGTQRSVEFGPDRWVYIQDVLNLVKAFAPTVKKKFPASLDVNQRQPGSFPRMRIFGVDAQQQIFRRVAKHICEIGMNGFPIARQPESVRQAIFRYIVEPNLTVDEISAAEKTGFGGFWTDSTSSTLLLLRGLIAGGVLAFAFGQKRWRVNYGLDISRQPGTKLAVPYRAKDAPTARSEFSHPDVIIVLTSLTYYYGGLTDEDMFLAFYHLAKSDQADIEYQGWVRDAPNLPPAYHHLLGINLKDKVQCIEEVFPTLRYAKGAIDYFLGHIVFPKEMKEFPYKLSASGWDIGQLKNHPITGFSGTSDSQKLLPLSVDHLNLPEQEHTNALVLEYLLRSENMVALMQPCSDITISDAQALLRMVTAMPQIVQVILDVGAQILELSNIEVAREWLKLMSYHGSLQAVIFFDNYDELCVLDRSGNVELLQTSSFAARLDACLVYLDESHTRGTDLKLPSYYRAAVTLGANLTKDRLVQACMRMRKLGKGQSVVFCIPEEIKSKIQTRTSKSSTANIEVPDVLNWAIAETFTETQRSMPLWAVQGQRFEHQSAIWAEARTEHGAVMSKSLAERFLEDEAQSLDARYRPRVAGGSTIMQKSGNKNLDLIVERCRQLNSLELGSATLLEEQERELSPEIQQEQQVQKLSPAQPAAHDLHVDLIDFVITGDLKLGSKAFMPAFEALRNTSAAAHLNVSQFPRDLLVTADFAQTIEVSGNTSHVSDWYQRPVQWILTSIEAYYNNIVKHMVIISPYEAQEIMPRVVKSRTTTLHLYAPRSNLKFRPLDALDLFTVPTRPKPLSIPRRLSVLLNLFAGQLYLDSFEEYIDVCKLLGLAWEKSAPGCIVAADGFVLHSGLEMGLKSRFKESPTKFLKVLMTKIRRNCESIEKTHVGKILDGTLLTRADFEEVEDEN